MTSFSTRVTFDHIRNSAAGFTSANPILGYGVTGLETDTGRIKVGDGVSDWNTLVYSTGDGIVEINGVTAQTITIAAGANVTVSTAGSTITIAAGGGGVGNVESVNGQTGVVSISAIDVTAAAATHASQHRTGGADVLLPVVTSATITASANNYSPPTGDIIRLTSTATSTAVITGLSGGSAGVVRVLANVGTNSLTLAHASSDSDSTNRFSISGAADLTLAAGAQAAAWYDDTSDVWRVSGGGSGGGSSGGIVSVNGQTATAVTLSASDVTAASTSHSTTHRAGGSDELLPLVTAVSLTASVNNYSLPTGDVFRLSHSNTTTVNITGLATAVDGSARLLLNVSTGASSSYTIKHADTNSTAVSQFAVPWAGDYVISPNGGAALVLYDATDSRWRVV